MRRFDVFNGDADGICALRQLRLEAPHETQLVTGLKHDIALLGRVDARAGDEVTVLDVSLARNREALAEILSRGATVRYFDHHEAGVIPSHPALAATIDRTGLACTSELVDRALDGRHRAWAVAGAFGDGLHEAAGRLAASIGLAPARVQRLRELGEALNYNAYAESEAEAIAHPAALYRIAARHDDPFSLALEPVVSRIARARAEDLSAALRVAPFHATAATEVHVLPDRPGSRRILGDFANARAHDDPARAHAVLAPLRAGGFAVSVRCPHRAATSASDFCGRFPTGGGRATAAGIGRLDAAGLEAFVRDFDVAFGGD